MNVKYTFVFFKSIKSLYKFLSTDTVVCFFAFYVFVPPADVLMSRLHAYI